MIAILSPAKTLDYDSVRHDLPEATRPRLAAETAELVAAAAKLDRADLMKLMGISAELADLNVERFRSFADAPERPAIMAFDGDVYTGLDAKTMDTADVGFAQNHLRVLSGLFGILRPMDLMKPYRLEMGTKRFPETNKVSFWWGDRIAKVLAQDVEESGEASILNLASQEYYAGVKGRLPASIRIVDVEFMTGDRFITMHAKLARGVMARWMIDNRVTSVDAMRGFDGDGYSFDEDASEDNKWTFRKAA